MILFFIPDVSLDPSPALIPARLSGDCIVADSVINLGQVNQPLLLLVVLMLRQLSVIAPFHGLLSPASFLPELNLFFIALPQHFALVNLPLLLLNPVHHEGAEGLLIDDGSDELGLLFVVSFSLFFLSISARLYSKIFRNLFCFRLWSSRSWLLA